MDSAEIAQTLGIKQGIISTGDSLDKTERDLEIITRNKADVKEMEAAAIAWVTAQYNIPFIALKSITDLLDSPLSSQDQVIKNLELASHNLCTKLIQLLHYLNAHQPLTPSPNPASQLAHALS